MIKPLHSSEYANVRAIFGLLSELGYAEKYLEPRLRMIPNGWRDFRMLLSVTSKLVTELVKTVPIEKRKSIQHELKNVRVEVTVKQTSPPNIDGLTYVPIDSLIQLMLKVSDIECLICEKTGKECKRCKLRKLFDSMLHYEIDSNVCCPYALIDWNGNIGRDI